MLKIAIQVIRIVYVVGDFSQSLRSHLAFFIRMSMMVSVNHTYASKLISLKIAIEMLWCYIVTPLLGGNVTCLDVIHHSTSQSYKWTLGSCTAADEYARPGAYITQCCTNYETPILTCKNSDINGWKDSHLEINGHRFCDDVVGYEARVQLNVSGI